jgi:hypothetical protein
MDFAEIDHFLEREIISNKITKKRLNERAFYSLNSFGCSVTT